MRRRNTIMVAIVAVALAAAGLIVMQQRDAGHEHASGEIYFCPMHPTVTSDRPGNCPICGMKLVRRTAAPPPAPRGPAAIALSPEQRVLANVKTMRVSSGRASTELITTGRVTFDERRIAQVTSYTAGRIERLFVNFTGDAVERGRPVATIYSPDLYSTQQEYLLALANRERMRKSGFAQARTAADALVESTRRRLQLFGMSGAQIDALARGGKPLYATTIVSPFSGVVTRKLVVPQQTVMAGEPLFEIADLSVVWVDANVYESDLPRIALGQRVSISSPALPGFEVSGAISFVDPVVNPETRSTRVRIDLPNRGFRLKPDMYVTVTIFAVAARPAIMIPASALVDRGLRQFVWVEAGSGTFAPREVRAGSRSSDRVEILSGLDGSETIVVDGAFLLESEAQLRSAQGS